MEWESYPSECLQHNESYGLRFQLASILLWPKDDNSFSVQGLDKKDGDNQN